MSERELRRVEVLAEVINRRRTVASAAAVLVLSALHVEQSVALAGALIYHAVHVVPTTLIGLACLRTQFLRDAPDRDKPAVATSTLPGA